MTIFTCCNISESLLHHTSTGQVWKAAHHITTQWIPHSASVKSSSGQTDDITNWNSMWYWYCLWTFQIVQIQDLEIQLVLRIGSKLVIKSTSPWQWDRGRKHLECLEHHCCSHLPYKNRKERVALFLWKMGNPFPLIFPKQFLGLSILKGLTRSFLHTSTHRIGLDW